MTFSNRLAVFLLLVLFGSVMPEDGTAQELEPRTLTNLPRDLNFFGASYIYASGNTLLDPSLPLKDFNGKIHTLALAYVRSVNFFGKSGKIDVILPFAGGDFTGAFEGRDFTDAYTGFGDLRIRAAINLTGAPSLELVDFKQYTQKLVSGVAVQLLIPTGSYKKDQLPNLGSNRWAIRINYGLSYSFKQWVLEGRVGAWLFSENNAFLGDNSLRQKPLWVAKSNLIRSFGKQGMWLAISAGYGYGARTLINDEKRDIIISQLRLGLTYALPLNPKNSLKFTVGSGIRFREGGDFDLFGISYTYSWLD